LVDEEVGLMDKSVKLLRALSRVVTGFSRTDLEKIKFVNSDPTNSFHPEAEYRYRKILLYPKFYNLNKEGRAWVLAHELGHWYRDEFIPLDKIMGWEPGIQQSVLMQKESHQLKMETEKYVKR
jgi:hypothetical protein